jgi:hypothetical protein
MNLKEFAALKVGDVVSNPMTPGDDGKVVNVTDSGVRVVWSEGSIPFFYSVNTTAWMHWVCVKGAKDDLDT